MNQGHMNQGQFTYLFLAPMNRGQFTYIFLAPVFLLAITMAVLGLIGLVRNRELSKLSPEI
jgi:hypothetical protein